MKSVSQLFIKKTKDEKTIYIINTELTLKFNGEQEAAQFLVEAIRFWREKRTFFCHNTTTEWTGEGKERKRIVLPEEEWEFSYKTPSDCGGCVRGQEILNKIFGNCRKFNALPFVINSSDREYFFSFDLLKHFAENGHESTACLIEEHKQEEVRKEADVEAEQKHKLLKEQSVMLVERLAGEVISEKLRQQILPYAGNNSLTIASPDVAVVLTSRSVYGSGGGGIGYYDQVHVFFRSHAIMKEWQWRDRYSESADKPWLAVHAIGTVKVSEKDNEVHVEVELVNNHHGNRTATYTFDSPTPTDE